MKEGTFKSSNGLDTVYYSYTEPMEVNGVFVAVHGMSEHILRYKELAKVLENHGIAFFGADNIAHGRTAKEGSHGVFADNNQGKHIVSDIKQLCTIACEKYPDKKTVLFGHSMGSFIVRCFCALYSDTIDGLIICGTAGKNPLAGAGNILGGIIKTFRGGEYKSELLSGLAFKEYNKRYTDIKTDYDWLSRDGTEVQKYLDDPLCGFTFSVDGMRVLTNLLTYANSDECFDKMRKDLPIFMISGDMDPVGDYGKGVMQVYDRYKSAGCNVQYKLYKDARHELLNETNKKEVIDDIITFTKKIFR